MSQTVEKNNRLVYIDIAKGILILLVVLGHVLTGSNFVTKVMIRILGIFPVPAFFAISGFLTNKESISRCSFLNFVVKKIKRLLIPYFAFELLGALIQTLMFSPNSIDFLGIATRILTAQCYIGADWFLVALFFAEIIRYWIVKYLRPQWGIALAVVFFALCIYLPEPNWFIANCRRVFGALGFILFGMYGKKLLEKDSWWLFAGGCVAYILGAALNTGTPSIALRLFENPFLFLLCGFSGTYLTFFISRRIASIPWIERFLTQCGKASIVIMGTHQNVLIAYVILYGHWTQIPIKLLLLLAIAVVEIPLFFLCRRFFPSLVGGKGKLRKVN